MGQASSVWGSSDGARVSLPFPVDWVTGLPLIDCPRCGYVTLIALTCNNTKNRGKRFFKCPRNQEGVPWSCRTYFFQPEYVKYLWKHGYLDADPDLTEVNLAMEKARSSREVIPVPLKLKNLFGYCETWDTSVALKLDHVAGLSAGVEMPRIGARLHTKTSFLSEDWLKSSLKEHIMGVSVAFLSTMNHSLACNLMWRNLTDPSRLSSNFIQEHLGHSLLSSIKYAYKVDQRDSSIRPTRGYDFLSSSQVGYLASGSKDSWCLCQEVDLRLASPFDEVNGALNIGMAARVILPLERRSTTSILPLSERFYLGGNRYLCCLGEPSSLLGFEALKCASASPELHGGGDIAVTAFADVSFDLPLKPLRELGIYGHSFISLGNLAKLTEHGRRKFSLTNFLQTFRSSSGFGVVVPTRLFRIEMNYCFDHGRGKNGVQFNFSSP